MGQSGIYVIENIVTGDVYIGSAVNLHKRKGHHFSALRRGDHSNPYLQRAWDKYGAAAFTFQIKHTCEPDECLFWEQVFIDMWQPEYNINPNVNSRLGRPHTPETRAKMSASRMGHAQPEEVRAKLSAAMQGKKMPPFTEEHKAKIGEANRRRVFTPEILANMSAAQRGKTVPPFSEEHRAKLSVAATEREARKRKGLGGS